MAKTLGEASSNVQDWKRRRRIPTSKQPKVLEIGNRIGLNLTAEDVMFPFPEDRPADHARKPHPDFGDMEPAR
nr:hypothetical protein [Sphingomonas profundi]